MMDLVVIQKAEQQLSDFFSVLRLLQLETWMEMAFQSWQQAP